MCERRNNGNVNDNNFRLEFHLESKFLGSFLRVRHCVSWHICYVCVLLDGYGRRSPPPHSTVHFGKFESSFRPSQWRNGRSRCLSDVVVRLVQSIPLVRNHGRRAQIRRVPIVEMSGTRQVWTSYLFFFKNNLFHVPRFTRTQTA